MPKITQYVPSPIRSAIRELRRRKRRRSIVESHFSDTLKLAQRWIKQRTEESNFIYELNGDDRLYLAHFISFALNEKLDHVLQLFDEVESDQELRSHLIQWTRDLNGPDAIVAFGRRLAWYAITRLTKPPVVVETGVAHGLGAAVLCSALLRNSSDGKAGHYFGTDCYENAGSMLTGRYREVGTILYGDSLNSLRALDCTVGLFINDSDHSFDYEMQEYRIVQPKLSEAAIIIGDNCMGSTALAKFSRNSGRRFIFSAHRSHAHWYPGDGIGISLPEAKPVTT